ncbi:hypothetical protein T09_15005 [Trichinella sp. T9]|nr:hypothetical protein T09_15005 [Trichinella sp. T9]
MLLWLRASLFVVVNSMDFTSSGCDTPPDAGGTTGIFMRSRAGPSMIEIRRMSPKHLNDLRRYI